MSRDKDIPVIKIDPSDTHQRHVGKTVLIEPASSAPSSTYMPLMSASGYNIIRKIGEGGMGVVYIAQDARLNRHVAIKRLHKASLENHAIRQRFFTEAKLIASLNHIYMVHVYALEEDAKGPYIVMEYVPGPGNPISPGLPPHPFTLFDSIGKNGPMPVYEAVDLMIKITRAIEYAHQSGVIHRDLKPSNILLDQSGEPKIVDFGLARNMLETSGMTVAGDKMLSIGYGAPEQEVDASTTDQRADIYGLGAIMYYCLTGNNPRFFRESDVTEQVRQALVKALAPDRDKRWSSSTELLTALMDIKENIKIHIPTIKTSWRCKWCETVNPVKIAFCSKCGWDGSEKCAECSADTRFGVPYCGLCGADAKEYERAESCLRTMKAAFAAKNYSDTVQRGKRFSGFKPSGLKGAKILEEITRLTADADYNIKRVDELRSIISTEILAQDYEQALHHIAEYETLYSDTSWAQDKEDMPARKAKRDLGRVDEAMAKKQWQKASALIESIIEIGGATAGKARLKRAKLRLMREFVVLKHLLEAVFAVLFIYIALSAPTYKVLGMQYPSAMNTFFKPIQYLHQETIFQPMLEWYCGVFNAGIMLVPQPTTHNTSEKQAEDITTIIGLIRADFDKHIRKIELEFGQKKELWPDDQIIKLTELQHNLQLAGDYDAWSAVKDEIDRFSSTKTVQSKDVVAAPEELNLLQTSYVEMIENAMLDNESKLFSATQEYINNLLELQKKLTIASQMDSAEAVNNEIKRVKSERGIKIEATTENSSGIKPGKAGELRRSISTPAKNAG